MSGDSEVFFTCSDDLLVYDKKTLQEAFERVKRKMKAAIHAKDVFSTQHYMICLATLYNALEKIDAKTGGYTNDVIKDC